MSEQSMDQASPGVPVGTGKPKRRGRLLWLAMGLLSAILIVNLFVAGYMLVARKPLRMLPGVKALTLNSPPQYLFSIYGVTKPMGVAVSPDGQRVYATEGDGERLVRIFDANGRPLGSLSEPQADVKKPMFVATDIAGQVYVSNGYRMAVEVYSPAGQYLKDIVPPNGEKWTPAAIAFDRIGRMYVTDIGDKHRVLVFDGERRFLRAFGRKGSEAGEFLFPNGIAVDDQGRVFVADSNNSRIQVFDGDGNLRTDIGTNGALSGGGLPRGMAIDDQNRLHVVDVFGHNAFVYNLASPKIELLYTFGDFGVDDGLFRFPNGLAIDPGGRVYVTDRENERIQVWAY